MSKSSAYSILLLHGNGGGGFRFRPSLPYFPSTVHVSAPDLPGFGTSPLPPKHPITMRFYGETVLALLDMLPRPRILYGTGIGGSFALEALQLAPECADGLILHAPVGTRLGTRLFPILMRPRMIREWGRRLISASVFRPIFKNLFFEHPERLSKQDGLDFFDGYRKAEAFSLMFDLITESWFFSLSPSSVPTVLLWGERERVLSPDQAADYTALLPNSRIHLIASWNHFPMLESPSEFASVTDTLSRQLLNQSNTQLNG